MFISLHLVVIAFMSWHVQTST